MLRILVVYFLLFPLSANAVDIDKIELISAHNRLRKNVGVPPLTYSSVLAASAQEWANHLKRTNHCKMQHSKPDGRYGENLYWASSLEWSNGRHELQKITPSNVVKEWGDEMVDYDYKNNSCTSEKMCGHYTQVIWKTTSTVGCAIAICEDTLEQVWVCQYQPPGNWIGQRPF